MSEHYFGTRTEVGRSLSLGLLGLLMVVLPGHLHAGGTPATGAVADPLIQITGSMEGVATGDWLSADDGTGLNTYHSFFIEVPLGADRLVVDLFDMDILYGVDDNWTMGVPPTEQTQERDRIRTYAHYLDDAVSNFADRTANTIATYTLLDPNGTEVITRRWHGSHFAPSNADNAWVTLFDSATRFDSGTFHTWADDFSGGTYAENDGSQSFTTHWIESQDTGVNSASGPGGGLVRITGGELEIRDLGDLSPDTGREPGIEREFDLSGFFAARLTFDYSVSSDIEEDDALVIELSNDGGSTWTVIDDLSGEELAYSGSPLYDISEFSSAQTRIRFRVESNFAESNESVRIDNVEIRAQTVPSNPPMAGHWELRIDMSTNVMRDATAASNGDETNAVGVRAHDGDASALGSERHIYAYTLSPGVNDNDSGRDYTFHPYLTHGCAFQVNNFDWDADLADNPGGPMMPFGMIDLMAPDMTYTQMATMADGNMWANSVANEFTDQDMSLNYGTWTLLARIDDPADGNQATMYLTDDDGAAPPFTPPLPPADGVRLYLPSDSGAAPAKPYLVQTLRMIDGPAAPNPPLFGETSRYSVRLEIINPMAASGSIEFSDPARLVHTRFPGGLASYVGTEILSHGTLLSEPAVSQTTAQDIVWNPGLITPGETANFTYQMDVSGDTGNYVLYAAETPGSGFGTRATWMDEAGVDFDTGELCELTIENPGPDTQLSVEVLIFTVD